MCITAIVGLALSAIGTGVTAYGQMQASEGQEKAEAARKQQMALDAQRRRRESIREMMMARATATSNASSQGASEGSGLQGGLSQIAGQAGRNILDTNQNEELGSKIFNANADAASGQTIAGFGSGLKDWGSTIMANNENIGKIGSRLKSGSLWGTNISGQV